MVAFSVNCFFSRFNVFAPISASKRFSSVQHLKRGLDPEIEPMGFWHAAEIGKIRYVDEDDDEQDEYALGIAVDGTGVSVLMRVEDVLVDEVIFLLHAAHFHFLSLTCAHTIHTHVSWRVGETVWHSSSGRGDGRGSILILLSKQRMLLVSLQNGLWLASPAKAARTEVSVYS